MAQYYETKAINSNDLFGQRRLVNTTRNPNVNQLINEYAQTAYACANLNADTVAKTKLRLYIRQGVGRKCPFHTKSVAPSRLKYLSHKVGFTSSMAVDEIIEHQVLDLLASPNPYWNGFELMNFTALYMEIVGRVGWNTEKNAVGMPSQIWLMLPQYLTEQTDEDGYPSHYGYGAKNKFRYELEEVITFKLPDLKNPYSDGCSPIKAVWQSLAIDDQFDASLAAMLENQARPDLIVSFPEGGPGDSELKRIETSFNSKFRRAGNGGVLFIDEQTKVTPLVFPAKDLAALQIHGVTKTTLANAFGVPLAMLDTGEVNRANMIASKQMHAENAILPRLRRLEAKLNQFLKDYYDPSGRMFFAFDDPSPDQKEELQQELVGYVSGRVITTNEARAEIGYPPIDGGDYLVGNFNFAGDSAPSNTTAVDTAAPADSLQAEQDIQTLPSNTLNGAQIASATAIVQQVAQGLLPRDSGLGQLQVLLNLTTDQAQTIMGSVGRGFSPPKPETNSPDSAKVLDPERLAELKQWKAKRSKTPKGDELVPILKKHFRRVKDDVLTAIGKSKSKKGLPEKFVPLNKWDKELAEDCEPVIEIYFAKGGHEIVQQIGASADVFNVTNPHLQKEIHKLTLKFAESTNRTTTKELNAALSELRESFADGITAGSRISDLTKRVEVVFENAEEFRAKRIALTESARAYSEGTRASAKESGLVRGFKLLLSSDPCPVCQAVYDNTPEVGIDDEKGFAGLGGNEEYPQSLVPIHPNCTCDVLPILDIQA